MGIPLPRAFLVPLIAIMLLAGCDHLGIGVTPIAEIVRDPAKFEGREVSLKGTVRETRKIPVIDSKSFVLADSTGEITVTAKGDLPAKGEKLLVRGKVQSLAIVGGQSFGTGVAEFERAKTF
jgi:hypothetical protein